MAMRADHDPLKELAAVQKRMNQLFESAMARTNFETSEGFDSWTPISDVYESDASLVLAIELPGLERKDIDVRIDGDELVVEGQRRIEHGGRGEHHHRVEREFGSFSRRFRLPSTADRDSVEASYSEGLLTVSIRNVATGPAGPVKIEVS